MLYVKYSENDEQRFLQWNSLRFLQCMLDNVEDNMHFFIIYNMQILNYFDTLLAMRGRVEDVQGLVNCEV